MQLAVLKAGMDWTNNMIICTEARRMTIASVCCKSWRSWKSCSKHVHRSSYPYAIRDFVNAIGQCTQSWWVSRDHIFQFTSETVDAKWCGHDQRSLWKGTWSWSIDARGISSARTLIGEAIDQNIQANQMKELQPMQWSLGLITEKYSLPSCRIVAPQTKMPAWCGKRHSLSRMTCSRRWFRSIFGTIWIYLWLYPGICFKFQTLFQTWVSSFEAREAPSALRLVTRHIGTSSIQHAAECHGIVQHDVQEMNLSNMNERFPFVRKLTGIGSDLEKDLAKRSAIRVKLI